MTTNSHQNYINKILSSNETIVNIITYSDYNTDNNLVFSGTGLGVVNSSVCGEKIIMISLMREDMLSPMFRTAYKTYYWLIYSIPP